MALFVTLRVDVRGFEGLWVEGHRCGYCEAKHFREKERKDESDPGPEKGFDTGNSVRLVDGVIGRAACPSSCETEDGGRETQHAAGFAVTDVHREVDKGAGVDELAENNKKDDEGRNPGVEFVVMYDFVAEHGDDECTGGNDYYTRYLYIL